MYEKSLVIVRKVLIKIKKKEYCHGKMCIRYEQQHATKNNDK